MLKTILKKKKVKKNPLKGYATRGSTVLLVQGDRRIMTKILDIAADRVLYEASNKPIEYRAPVTIRNYGDGVPWEYTVPEIVRFTEDRDVYWKSVLPDSAKTMERRDNFRVQLPASDPSRVRLFIEGKAVRVPIVDISATGAKLKLDASLAPHLTGTELFEDAMLLFADTAIACEMANKWLLETEDYVLLGVKFEGMDYQDKGIVRKFITTTEREILKSRPDK